MANLSITMKNEAKVARAWAAFPGEMGKAIAQAIQVSGTFLSGQTKEHIRQGTNMWKAPLDTGRMMGGIHPVFSGMKAYIRPARYTPYAEFVHEGTASMQARPFFDITAEQEKDNVTRHATRIINSAIQAMKI